MSKRSNLSWNRIQDQNKRRLGQWLWLWLSWQRSHFWHQRSVVWIQSTAIFYTDNIYLLLAVEKISEQWLNRQRDIKGDRCIGQDNIDWHCPAASFEVSAETSISSNFVPNPNCAQCCKTLIFGKKYRWATFSPKLKQQEWAILKVRKQFLIMGKTWHLLLIFVLFSLQWQNIVQ